jgi:hypothetical protein
VAVVAEEEADCDAWIDAMDEDQAPASVGAARGCTSSSLSLAAHGQR